MESFKCYVGENGTLPTRASEYSAGWDLYSSKGYVIEPGCKECISTNIKISLPKDTYGRIAPRSGLAFNYAIDVLAGVIDNDYRGEIKVILINFGESNYFIKQGDRIAQLILTKYDDIFIKQIYSPEELGDSSRNENGFGSSGV